jgi:hypothetical protein
MMDGSCRVSSGVYGIHATKQATSEKREEKKIERGNGSSRMDDASHRTLTQISWRAPHTYMCLGVTVFDWAINHGGAIDQPLSRKASG